MPRIAIVGVGAIGGVLAGLLETTHAHDLTLCTRRPLPSLTVETPDGPVQVQAANVIDPSQATSVDWIFVATKTYDSVAAAKWFPALTGPETRLAIIQNGIEHRENFAGLFPEGRILPIIIDVPAERRSDTVVLQRSTVLLRTEDTPDGHAFAALFANSKAKVEPTQDFLTVGWHKLCINAAGVLCALTLKPNGIFRDEQLGQAALAIMAECIAVGRAEGAHLDDSLPAKILANYRAGSPDSVNSLLADRLANRPTEIDIRNGIIVRLGAKHGIPTPLNGMAIALLKSMVP